MIQFIYNLSILIFFPILFLRFLYKNKTLNNSFDEFKIRFLGIPIRENIFLENVNPKNLVWIHAVSLGETYAAIPMIHELEKKSPHVRFLLTSTTKSGYDAVESLLKSGKLDKKKICHQLCPYDFYWSMKYFVQSYSPSILILIETEIWPNLICCFYRENKKIILASARLSLKSLSRYKRTGWIFRFFLNKVSLVLAQSELDRHNFKKVGLLGNIEVVGNLKFDLPVDQNLKDIGVSLRKYLDKRSVFLALSTRKGEEKEILAAWKKVYVPTSLLILVPRHPERSKSVLLIAQGLNLSCILRSELDLRGNKVKRGKLDRAVLIGDSLRESQIYIAASDIVLMGGSLKKLGGQNPIEACAQSKPVFFGPHMFNFRVIASELVKKGGGFEIKSYEDWFDLGNKLFKKQCELDKAVHACYSVYRSGTGPSKKCADHISKFLK
ncbi:MAG: hypothetical protein CBC42_04045 [Betaproteobacteria bacterium TMED82]|nr:MAG: hypothetical protein CBC42_04045 [Betaproteobacteria bacterium TMED82]|tara:strand:- start:34424 stop:35740 length:1317 start_codon:yes stop_codon:yes gene_type:complete